MRERTPVRALCARSFAKSVRRAAGVQPLTCPPLTVDTFRPDLLEGATFLYLKLHGLPGEPYLYGDAWTTALHVDQVATLNLQGCTLFAATCHFLDSPWPLAFARAGVEAIVAGHGLNFARAQSVAGADRLGRLFRLLWQGGVRPDNALRLAKRTLAVSPLLASEAHARADTLAFEFFWGSHFVRAAGAKAPIPAGASPPARPSARPPAQPSAEASPAARPPAQPSVGASPRARPHPRPEEAP